MLHTPSCTDGLSFNLQVISRTLAKMAGARGEAQMATSSGTSVLSASSTPSTTPEDRSRSNREVRHRSSVFETGAAPYDSAPHFRGGVSGASGSADPSEVATESGTTPFRSRRLQGRAEDEISQCSGFSETPSMAALTEDEREVRRIERYQQKLNALVALRMQKTAAMADAGSEVPATDASSAGEGPAADTRGWQQACATNLASMGYDDVLLEEPHVPVLYKAPLSEAHAKEHVAPGVFKVAPDAGILPALPVCDEAIVESPAPRSLVQSFVSLPAGSSAEPAKCL